ncbi:MAG: SUMF1/EgtB/PvdO family nonheme iron enzyme [Kiritimatiellae bacterium]|nr:SUMF1/EgtB/PvdO family nonheme iron enzyme [Kiritimatiellia bacterium]
MKRKALFVGVDQYDDESIHDLQCAANDAALMLAQFRTIGYETVLLANPRRDQVIQEFTRMTEGLGAGDEFLFYFAGHGFSAPGGNDHLLFCRDDQYVNIQFNYAGIPFGLLQSKTERAGLSRMFIVDACRSNPFATRGVGELRDLLPSVDSYVKNVRSGGLAVMRSCGQGQCALELPSVRRGVFSLAMDEVIDNSRESGEELVFDQSFAQSVYGRMMTIAEKNNLQLNQTPEIKMSANWGRVVLVEGRVPEPPHSQQETIVECPLCGRKNRVTETFRCKVCSKDNLCLAHSSGNPGVCKSCEKADQDDPEENGSNKDQLKKTETKRNALRKGAFLLLAISLIAAVVIGGVTWYRNQRKVIVPASQHVDKKAEKIGSVVPVYAGEDQKSTTKPLPVKKLFVSESDQKNAVTNRNAVIEARERAKAVQGEQYAQVSWNKAVKLLANGDTCMTNLLFREASTAYIAAAKLFETCLTETRKEQQRLADEATLKQKEEAVVTKQESGTSETTSKQKDDSKKGDSQSSGNQSLGTNDTYIVQNGDTWASIAYRHRIRIKDLRTWNPGVNFEKIRVGQVVRIRDKKTENKMQDEKIAAGTMKNFILPGGVKMEMVYVTPGIFQMGGKYSLDAEPIHSVCITKGYWIGKYPVTQRQWSELVVANNVAFSNENLVAAFSKQGYQRDVVNDMDTSDFPMESISWNDCDMLVKVLNRNERSGRTWVMPTEAQWEFAARGGNKSKGYIYSGGNEMDKVGWYYENSGVQRLLEQSWDNKKLDSNKCRPHSVREKDVGNELGIVGMSGNVFEWCRDIYDKNYYSHSPKSDPCNEDTNSGSNRVQRGGTWYIQAYACRIVFRNDMESDTRRDGCGFRLCCSADVRMDGAESSR